MRRVPRCSGESPAAPCPCLLPAERVTEGCACTWANCIDLLLQLQ